MQLRNRLHTLTRLVVWLLPACWPLASSAELLNRIEVHRENNVGVIHVLLTRPMIYMRHFPPEHSYLVHIYFNDLSLDRGNMGGSMHGSARSSDEFLRSPPNDIVPEFWVAYNNHGTNDLSLDPFHLLVQFVQPVHYKIVPDADNQGFYIFVLSTDVPTAKTPPKNTEKERATNPADPTPANPDPPATGHPDVN
jgi:hypothetical protein